MHLFRPPLALRLLFPTAIWKGEKNAVYLTFDDGPTPLITNKVLDLLFKLQVKATFFCIGKKAEEHSAIVSRIRSEGHQIGNHSFQHEKGTHTGNDNYFESIKRCDEIVKSNLFRPPYGKITPVQFLHITKKLGKKVVFWSWLSYDYDNEISTETILLKSKSIKGGDILVFHDAEKSAERLLVLLEHVIREVKDKGLHFKTL